MKMNNRFIYGILSIFLAAVIAFIAIPAVTSKTSSTCGIARMKNAVPRGTLITTNDVELAEVGGFNLPDGVARQTQDVIGTYAATDLFPGDYILPEKVSSVPLSSDLSLNGIPDGMVAISITTQTLATALSDKLQGGDIIRLYHYDDDNELEPVTDIPELRFVKVLSVTDSKGLDVDYTTPPEEDEERQQTATITVLATPEQALLLTRYENEGRQSSGQSTPGYRKEACFSLPEIWTWWNTPGNQTGTKEPYPRLRYMNGITHPAARKQMTPAQEIRKPPTLRTGLYLYQQRTAGKTAFRTTRHQCCGQKRDYSQERKRL